MNSLLHDLFPDAPLWVPWVALISMISMLLFFLACLVASPFEAARNRHALRDNEGMSLAEFVEDGIFAHGHRKEK